MQVILHIGAPKTGTSALQYFLNANQKRLERYGIYYPGHDHDANRVSGGHGKLARLVTEGDLGGAAELSEVWLQQAAAKGLKLLLSAEEFYAQADRLPALFAGHEVKVIAYARDPVEFLIANHNQSIKRHFGTEKLPSSLERAVNARNRGVSGEIFFDWASAVGKDNIEVLPYYKSAFPNGRIEHSFLSWLGVPKRGLSKFRVPRELINTSYTAEALELKRLLNFVLDPEDRASCHQVDLFFQKHSDRRNNERGLIKGCPVDPTTLKRVYDRFGETNQRLLNELIKDPPQGFLQPPKTYERGYTADLEEICKLYKRFAAQNPRLADELTTRVEAALQQKAMPYSLFQLAEIMGLPSREPAVEELVPERLLQVFRAPKANAVDYLRTLAQVLSHQGYKGEALAVIREAERLRPKGVVIKEMRLALENELK